MIVRGYEAPRLCLVSLALSLSIVTTGTAHAHAPPQATDIRWLGERAIIRTNRGLVLQDEPASSFRLLCNDAYEASLSEVIPFELSSDGRVVLANYGAGIVLSSSDHCSFEPASGPLAGLLVLALARDSRGKFLAGMYPADDSAPALFASDDDGRSFQRETNLPGVPTGVQIAPSDPARVYVSTSVSAGSAVTSNLEVSTDGGRAFRATPVELEYGQVEKV